MFFEFHSVLINSDNITYIKHTLNNDYPEEIAHSISIYFNDSSSDGYLKFSTNQEGLDYLKRKLKM